MAFEMFCIVELFGHNRIAGKVTEQEIGGASFIRVDVPKTSKREAFTKMYGPSAIYSFTPVDERTAQIAAESYEVEAIEVWRLSLPEEKLALATGDDNEEDFGTIADREYAMHKDDFNEDDEYDEDGERV